MAKVQSPSVTQLDSTTTDEVAPAPVDASAQQAAGDVTARRIAEDDPAAKIVETVKSTLSGGEAQSADSHAELVNLTLTKGPDHPETLQKLKWLIDVLPGAAGVSDLKEAFSGKAHGHKIGILRRVREGLMGLVRILVDIHTLGVGGRLIALLSRIASYEHKAEDAAFAVQWAPLLKALTHGGFSDETMKKFFELSKQSSLVERAETDIDKLFDKHEQAAADATTPPPASETAAPAAIQ